MDGVGKLAADFIGDRVAETPAEYVVARPTVYLDTTIPSFLTAWPSRDAEKARKQRITHEWWNLYRWQFDVCVSEWVYLEAASAMPQQANDVLRPRMMHICHEEGYTCPRIVTPDEIMRLRTHV